MSKDKPEEINIARRSSNVKKIPITIFFLHLQIKIRMKLWCLKFSKTPKKNFLNFCPSIYKEFESKMIALDYVK